MAMSLPRECGRQFELVEVFPLPLQIAGAQREPQLTEMDRAQEGVPSKFGAQNPNFEVLIGGNVDELPKKEGNGKGSPLRGHLGDRVSSSLLSPFSLSHLRWA